MLPRPFICASQERTASTVTTNIQPWKVKRRPIAPLRLLPQPRISKSDHAFSEPLSRNKDYSTYAYGAAQRHHSYLSFDCFALLDGPCRDM